VQASFEVQGVQLEAIDTGHMARVEHQAAAALGAARCAALIAQGHGLDASAAAGLVLARPARAMF